MKKIKLTLILALCLFLLGACGKKKTTRTISTPPVEVAEVLSHEIPLFVEAIGHVTAFNTVEIKSRIEGELMAIHYDQGDMVEEGKLLLTIDPRPYIAQLGEAKGALQEDEAALIFARERVERYSTLVGSNYISKLEYDQYVTDVAALEGSINKNRSTVDNAQVNLNYCYITAPFTGRTGKKLIDKGNLIANDGSTLLVINQTQPIYSDFSIPERDLTKLFAKSKNKELKVKVFIPESDLKPIEGNLIVIDNAINSRTGMIPLRAQFANKNEHLWPGQFIRAHLILDHKPNAILIPETAVNMGQKGKYVYVVKEDHTAEVRQITVGERINTVLEITSGLKEGEYVVTNGQLNVRPGGQVKVKSVSKDYLKNLKEFKGD